MTTNATEGPEPAAGKEFALEGFTEVSISSALEYEITQSPQYSIRATGDDRLIERLKMDLSGQTLKIGLGWLGSIHCPDGHIKVMVTMPELRKLTASGAVKGTARGFKSDKDFALDLSGAGQAEIGIEAAKAMVSISGAGRVNGELKAQNAGFALSGAGRCQLTGTGGDTRLELSGAGRIDLSQFQMKNADVRLSGAGRVRINLDGTLNAQLSGASLLEYTGNVVLGQKSVTGASRMRKI
jgi:hypothetical protein